MPGSQGEVAEPLEHPLVGRAAVAAQVPPLDLLPDPALHAARLHDDHPQPEREQLAPQAVGSALERELGGGVRTHERQGPASRHRADVDDAPARGFEKGKEGLRDGHRPDQVHLQDVAQLVQGDELEGTGGWDTRVVDERSERRAGQRSGHLITRAGDARRVRHVHQHRHDARRLERGAVLLPPHGPKYPKAPRGEVARDRGADAARGSGHNDALIHGGGIWFGRRNGVGSGEWFVTLQGDLTALRRMVPLPTPHASEVQLFVASAAARVRSAASIWSMETGAGTVQPARSVVGTLTAATSPSGPSSTTAVARSSGPWFALMTSVHVPAVGHVRLSACTPSRDVSVNSSVTVCRAPFTIPSAVPVTM